MEDHSIDRADLDSPTTEPNSPDPILQSYFRQQLQQRYADPSQTLTTNNGAEVDSTRGSATEQVQPDQEDAYDFRLFTRPSNSGLASIGKSSAPQRITLKSPSPAAGGLDPESGGRPDTYYFTGDTGSELAEQYARAAVSGEDVDEGLKMRWKGMELPWRVSVIKTAQAGEVVVGVEHQSQAARTNGRKRSGKKRRIVMRRRMEARATKEVVARQSRAEKEAAEREKRTRRNRERKVKKRLKDKVKKLGTGHDAA